MRRYLAVPGGVGPMPEVQSCLRHTGGSPLQLLSYYSQRP
jgi:hypothetical protein